MVKKLIIIGFFLVVALFFGAASYLYDEINKPLKVDESVVYTVQRGASLRSVLTKFEQEGWISQARLTELWLRYQEKTAIQRGEYEIQPGMNAQQVVEKMIKGEKILYSIQFIEGQRIRDYMSVLANHPNVTQTLTGLPFEDITKKVDPELSHLEGWIFPDTYLFENETTDLQLLRVAYTRMKRVLAEEWERRSDKTVMKTPYEALILASIIEKETGAAWERDIISGVFTRRLQLGMRLQTDPTIIYGLGEDFTGNLTRSHLRTDTPYNTYTRGGLTPTPIASPGREAIWAALNPADGDTLFFVAKGDGTHHFSVTLREHNNAVNRYQRNRVQGYTSFPPPESDQ